MNKIYLCLAHMSGNEQKYIQEAFDRNWVVTMGPNVDAFEEDLCAFVNSRRDVSKRPVSADDELRYEPYPGLAKHIAALASGTSAVHLALLACGVRPGDEVMAQSFSFCASAHPVTYLGATPVFVDSEPDTWNMDPDLLDHAIADRIASTGRKPRAIVATYLYGMPGPIDKYLAIGEKYGIPVIEDAAEALGSRFDGRVCGTYGAYGVLSFNGNKIITTSGGGALICPDAEARDRMLFYATQAREAYPYYQHEKIGYNYRMSNVLAGIGRGQMTILQEHLEHHHMVQRMYEELLAGIPGLTVHRQPDDPRYDSNYWLSTLTIDSAVHVKNQESAYSKGVSTAIGGVASIVHKAGTLRTDCQPNDNIEAMRTWLDSHDIEARPVWKPLHLQPCYAEVPRYTNGVSEDLFHRGLCLPAGPCVTEDDVRYIVDTIKAAL